MCSTLKNDGRPVSQSVRKVPGLVDDAVCQFASRGTGRCTWSESRKFEQWLKVWSAKQQNWILLPCLLTGSRHISCQTEETNLWHHQCLGRHRVDRKEKQKQHTMEVKFLLYIFFYSCEVITWDSEFRGAGPGCNSQEIGEKLTQLRNEVAALEMLEKNLDQHKQVCNLSCTFFI